jgi:outer membrane protein OmpU
MQNHEGISMKSILLASASLVGFASVAAAEVSFSGDASVGYNDNVEGGFFWEANLTVGVSAELNNGLMAGGDFILNIADDQELGQGVTSGEWDVYLKSETAGMYFGDTDQATEVYWSGIDGMEADGFDEDGIGDAILRGEITFGSVAAALSYNVGEDELTGLQVAADATFGAFNVGVAYQDDSFGSEIIGLSAGGTFGAATVAFAYADNSGGENSIGISVGYPVGPVSLSAYYAINDIAGDAYGIGASYASGAITVDAGYDVGAGADSGLFDLEGTYDVGNGMKLWAGVLDMGGDADGAYYVAGTLDLGSGASLLVSFVEDNDDTSAADDIGGPELNDGTTAKISFSF